MGNEMGQLKDYSVSKESFGTASDWVLYEGRRHASKPIGPATENSDDQVLDDISGNVVTVFVGMPEEKKGKTSILHNNVKTLMTLRHPDLLRFLSWRETSSRLELVTEHVRPLCELRARLTELDVSGGLLAVLRAVGFLHQQAGMCHNNLGLAAVFVTSAGAWRLGGCEFVRRFSEASAEWLQQTAAHRYQPALAPEEAALTGTKPAWQESRPWCRDVYAYGVLVDELIGICVQSEFPGARHFQSEVKRRLLSRDPMVRPALAELEGHDFFSNEFNQIHEFLESLVLKSQQERATFFVDLASRLRAYPEELVAGRLSALCLGRLVLLDADACRHFLPRLLTPRADQFGTAECVFSPPVFRRFIVPQLLRIFHVRDAHIRLVLLQHFSKYVEEIPKHLLAEVVLPELLLGIRDTHDQLVAATLRALADLVPVLGAHVVIGSHRHRHFGNGTPKASQSALGLPVRQKRMATVKQPDTAERQPTLLELAEKAAAGPDPLPERRSPEGGEELQEGTEGAESGSGSEQPLSDGPDDWSDWEATDAGPEAPPAAAAASWTAAEEYGPVAASTPARPAAAPAPAPAPAPAGGGMKLSGRAQPRRPPAPPPPGDEFERFSIQVRRRQSQEDDLFADMEPVIRSARRALPAREPEPELESEPTARLDMFRPADGDLSAAAWDDHGWDDL